MDENIQIVIRPKLRRLRLEIAEHGKLVVTIPPHTPDMIVRRFISDHRDWIEKQQNKQKGKVRLQTSSYMYLFGIKYELVIQENQEIAPGFTISGRKILYNPIAKSSTQINSKLLYSFLKRTFEAYVVPRTKQLAETMDLQFSQIKLREQKTRWGSCSSKGTVSFNWRLVHFEPKIIDYVIIHELAHLQEANHGRAFWRLVASYAPHFATAKKTLQRYYW